MAKGPSKAPFRKARVVAEDKDLGGPRDGPGVGTTNMHGRKSADPYARMTGEYGKTTPRSVGSPFARVPFGR